MKYSKKKIPSWGKIWGGKSRYARSYISLFPDVTAHKTYIEPYAGGAGILMNKERHPQEIISDVNADIFTTLFSLRDSGDKLKKIIHKKYFNYSEETFRKAQSELASLPYCVARSAAYIAVNRMSRTGLMRDYASQNRLRGGKMGDQNAWENYINNGIDLTIERLQYVTIYRNPAIEILKQFFYKDCIFYLDPPYLHETRVTTNAYLHEMTREQHIELLKYIVNHPAKIFISGYDSKLYRSYLKNWKVHSFHRACDSGQTTTKTRRIEVLWESP